MLISWFGCVIMIRHPITKVGIRSLLHDSSTFIFLGFTAAIMGLFIVLDGMGKSQAGNVFSKNDRILIVSNAIAPRYLLPVRYAYQVASSGVPGIEHVAAITFIPARLSGTRQRLAAMAVDPESLLRANTDMIVGEAMARRWIEDRSGLLVGRDLAARLNLKIGDTVSVASPSFRMAGGNSELRLRVRALYGVRDEAYPSYGIVVHDGLIRPRGQETTMQGVNSIMVLLSDRQHASPVSQSIDAIFAKSPVPTRTSLREQFVEAFNTQGTGVATLIRLYGYAGIAAGMMVLATFCYYNARRLESGWRRLDELGFGPVQVVLRFAGAMAFLIAAGAATGIAVTLAGGILFKTAIEQNFQYFSMSPNIGLLLLPLTGLAAFVLAAASLGLVMWQPIGSRRPASA